ncbi:TIGR03084 family metal-binding protein [Mycolicibacterium llatzerense]|uniref:TIGR03084 family metal-binding protein n=1 Tax=Mycolicibacterium llatzerense TaxID=280871 RepID=UPI0008DD66B7|nr:TIGR03084 family metal-binding protein [Mycolicibacterium llatzerense]MCT7366047.1 TIGR03084 family protein [Mycolicibacterium llatzerense]
MMSVSTLLDDLVAESADLDRLVADLEPAEWKIMTPAPGWTVAHQIAHLAWTDEIALLSATEPSRFVDFVRDGLAAADSVPAFIEAVAAEGAQSEPAELLARWRDGRDKLAAALSKVEPGVKLPWLGPPMSVGSMATARLMETWAHGQDVADALGVQCEPTTRLRHVAHIGVRARGYAFLANGKQAPEADVRVELKAPDGDIWTWGAEDATDRVTGSALDFCHRVTQRRHRDDLDLVTNGPIADEWLDIAQAFAGPPGAGREPGQHKLEEGTQR